MSMSLSLSHQIYIQCDCCNGSTEKHERGCPREQLKHLHTRMRGPDCPVCPSVTFDNPRGRLLINQDDFLECTNKKCRAVFTRSLIAAGHDPETLPKHQVIDFDANEFYTVAQFPNKGKGKFQYLRVLANIREGIRHQKAIMKEARRRRK